MKQDPQTKADWEDAKLSWLSMNCPHCKKPLPASFVDTRAAGSRGGKVKSPLKARTSEQARAAVMARWAKRKKVD
jgi:hypothetical protein